MSRSALIALLVAASLAPFANARADEPRPPHKVRTSVTVEVIGDAAHADDIIARLRKEHHDALPVKKDAPKPPLPPAPTAAHPIPVNDRQEHNPAAAHSERIDDKRERQFERHERQREDHQERRERR